MSVGLFVMILDAALMEGYVQMMERYVVDMEVGDVQIFAGDYRDAPSIHTRIDEPDRVLATLDGAGFGEVTIGEIPGRIDQGLHVQLKAKCR